MTHCRSDQFALTAQATSQWIEKLFPLSIDAQKNIPGMHQIELMWLWRAVLLHYAYFIA
ncbi:MAG: hypothetical protein R3A45_05080 [Bdellovibrionota bacterium]